MLIRTFTVYQMVYEDSIFIPELYSILGQGKRQKKEQRIMKRRRKRTHIHTFYNLCSYMMKIKASSLWGCIKTKKLMETVKYSQTKS